ncbi:MAG TPA: glycosyltransferase family 4 protein [Ktedonobacteraceae bacterium]|nr:glycosyltransferase family 4 protein [Ktedonobacteraceae bacterium]
MSNIRVAMITFDWYPFDPLVRRIAVAAVDEGHQVDVICLSQKGEKRYEVSDGVNVYRLPMDRGYGQSLPLTLLIWFWFTIRAGLKVARLHFKRRYDIVHVHNMPDFLVFSALIPRIFGAKVILHVQDVSPELMASKARGRTRKLINRLAIFEERISTAFAHHVITVGWPFEELLLKRGVPKEKLTIILNSADPKIFPAARRSDPFGGTPSNDRPLILMYHGTVAERNGLDVAVRALALAMPDAPYLRLHIQGRGEYIPVLQELAKELGVLDRMRFTPPQPPEHIVDFVVEGDVGIIPYRNDDFMKLILPTKAYEFSWMCRPMIVSDTPAIRSMFRPESIVLCDPSKPESFAEAIVELYHDAEKRVKLAANAAEDYHTFQWENMAERYRTLLKSLSGKQQSLEQQELSSSVAGGGR